MPGNRSVSRYAGITSVVIGPHLLQGSNDLGGLIGSNVGGSVSNSYSSAQAVAHLIGDGSGSVDEASALISPEQMESRAFWESTDWDVDFTGGQESTWRVYDGLTAPLLNSFLRQTVIVRGSNDTFEYDGTEHAGSSHSVSDPHAVLLRDAHYDDSRRTNAGTTLWKVVGLARDQGEDVYAIVIGNLAANGNYEIMEVSGSFVIDPAVLEVIVADAVRFFGEANPAFDVTYDGFVRSDDESGLAGTLLIVTAADTTSMPDSYLVEAEGLTSDNYTIVFVPGTLLIQGGLGNLDWIGDLRQTYLAAVRDALKMVSDVNAVCLIPTDDEGVPSPLSCFYVSLFQTVL